MTTKVILLTTVGSGTWIVPADWGSPNNIQAIGAGAGGLQRSGTGGGDGGSWSREDNVSLTPGSSVPYNVGTSGSNTTIAGDTWFGSPAVVLAKGGDSTTSNIGSVSYLGGVGTQNAGGGAGGPYGAGQNAVNATGGAGDAGHGGAGGGYYTDGGHGTEWGASYGSGGGGGFGALKGGAFGGGAGGGGGSLVGYHGGIRIEYTPGTPVNTVTETISAPAPSASSNVAMAATMAAIVGLGAISAYGSFSEANALTAGATLQESQAQGGWDQSNPAHDDAALPVLQTFAAVSAANPVGGSVALPEIFISTTIAQVLPNYISGTIVLPPPQTSGTGSATHSVSASSTISAPAVGVMIAAANDAQGAVALSYPRSDFVFRPLNSATASTTLGQPAAQSMLSAINPVQGISSLPAIITSGQLGALNALQGIATLPAIQVVGSIRFVVAYEPDPRYFVQLALRPFYADLEPRSFLAQLPARTFYILSDPNMTPTFDTKDPRETVVLTFDATADLATGETLTAVREVDVTMMRGSDPDASAIVSEEVINPSQITIGSATIAAGHGVQAIASAGLTGCWYLIAITCATSNPDKILTLKGILQVSSS